MPSISFFPYASIMAVSISRLALGWCCAVFLSRHMSSMPVTITLLILSASSWCYMEYLTVMLGRVSPLGVEIDAVVLSLSNIHTRVQYAYI